MIQNSMVPLPPKINVRIIAPLSGKTYVEFKAVPWMIGQQTFRLPLHYLVIQADAEARKCGEECLDFFHGRYDYVNSWNGPRHAWSFFILGSDTPLGPDIDMSQFLMENEEGQPWITVYAIRKELEV